MVLIATLFEVTWDFVAYTMQYARGCKAYYGLLAYSLTFQYHMFIISLHVTIVYAYKMHSE